MYGLYGQLIAFNNSLGTSTSVDYPGVPTQPAILNKIYGVLYSNSYGILKYYKSVFQYNKKILGPWIAHLNCGSFGPVVNMPLKIFLFLAPVVILFSGQYVLFW